MIHIGTNESTETPEQTRCVIYDLLVTAKHQMTIRYLDALLLIEARAVPRQTKRRGWKQAKQAAVNYFDEAVAVIRSKFPNAEHQLIVDEMVRRVFPNIEQFRARAFA